MSLIMSEPETNSSHSETERDQLFCCNNLKEQRDMMLQLKKQNRPNQSLNRGKKGSWNGEIPNATDAQTYAANLQCDGQSPSPMDCSDDFVDSQPEMSSSASKPRTPRAILDEIITEMNIAGNPEQERAVRMIAEHFIRNNEIETIGDVHAESAPDNLDQLLLYVAGVGGTGKSHVIKAVVEFFERCNAREQLLLSAPTGIAAVLIDGYTIHALTFLGPQREREVRLDELSSIWKNVKYLFVDEVSMIGALFLSQISHRIGRAKEGDCGSDTDHATRPFGGVNVICMGDFGQLKPVKGQSLLSHKLVKNIHANQGQSVHGQHALHGVHLWRQIENVICLEKNWRQLDDPRYAELVARIRLGCATGHGKHSDVDILSERLLNVMQRKTPHHIICDGRVQGLCTSL